MTKRILVLLALAWAVSGCGHHHDDGTNNTGTALVASSPVVVATPVPMPTASPLPPPPYVYNVYGLGNHPASICVPATRTLKLRISPHLNTQPLLPAGYLGAKASDGNPVYDGSPASYAFLQVNLSIPYTSATINVGSNVDKQSVGLDFSAVLSSIPNVSSTPAPDTAPLSTPEYTDLFIFGSDPYDGFCTYWEHYFGKCSSISSKLQYALYTSCPAGQVKVLVSNIVSDYPCTNDRFNWCAGQPTQIVPDYQAWGLSIEAATEDTLDLGQPL